MLDLPSNYVETAGYRTHFVESGSGVPLILIHGGGAGADGLGNWQQCFPWYTPHFRTIAYDMVGFGKTDTPDVATFPYDRQARTAQAIALIEALDQGPVHLIGNSMGSVVAMGVAMQRPDLVRKMTLMGSAGLNRKVPPAVAASANYDFSMEAMRNVMRVLTRPEFVIDEDLVRYRYELLADYPERRRSFLRTVQVVIDSGGLFYEEEEVATIQAPTLVFHGRDDKVIPLSDAIRTMELIKEGHGHFVPNCGHWAMMEQPEIFGRVTANWLLAD